MRFTVTWHPGAESELTDIWIGASDRAEVRKRPTSSIKSWHRIHMRKASSFTAIEFSLVYRSR
jgi:hypothetical protein